MLNKYKLLLHQLCELKHLDIQFCRVARDRILTNGISTWAAEQGGTGGTCTPHLFWKGGTRGYTL